MSTPSWEQSVERARLASLKTFEGRLEIAQASFEQIPPNGKGSTHSYTLADFAEEAGLEYQAVMDYRDISKWWGDSRPQTRISWTTAREAKRTGKWKDGEAFITFTLRSDPPEGHKSWTVDALREHLGRGMTNTGKLAKALREGAKVTQDDLHVAAALDRSEEAAEEIEEIASGNARLRAGVEARRTIEEKLPEPDPIYKQIDQSFGHAPYEQVDRLVAEIERLLSENAAWLARNGSKQLEGEAWADICMDSLAESKGKLDIAFRNAGVGVSLDEEAEALLG